MGFDTAEERDQRVNVPAFNTIARKNAYSAETVVSAPPQVDRTLLVQFTASIDIDITSIHGTGGILEITDLLRGHVFSCLELGRHK